jgi:hypothetical protein
MSNVVAVTTPATLAATILTQPGIDSEAVSDSAASEMDATVSTSTTVAGVPEPAVSEVSVGDLVWVDDDADGVQDVDEAHLGGVVVRLVGSDGTVVQETVSDSHGRYRLTARSSGSLALEVVIPKGYQPTAVDVGADDTVDSDVDPQRVVVGPVEITVQVALDEARMGDADLDIGLVAVPDESPIDTGAPAEETAATLATTTTTTTHMPTTTQPATPPPTTDSASITTVVSPPPTEPVSTTTVASPPPTEPVSTTSAPPS